MKRWLVGVGMGIRQVMIMLVFCQCSGTESQLSVCPHSSDHDCTEAEAAGVFCEEAAPVV